ncbi:hypothetical protein PVAND_012786 [Polypedilum vanderplanki]|uniref:Integrin beta n=1 Tax=Polypedilum vanderplanki TaxID=319348 RepID=A0A9J6CNI1_POLVA|nr:hypothetical protein PVAND_012786 [Polypedilum vanderplanki]
MRNYWALALISLLIIKIVLVNANSKYCVNQDTCDKCLNQHPTCAWCSDRLYEMRRARCMTEKDLLEANCRKEFIQINHYEPMSNVRDDDLRDFNKDFDSVQIRPQSVRMKLQKNRQQTVKLKYKPAKNYPLDLYLLMDLTWSMRDDKETLVKMGGSLSTSLKNLTENFRLGFGSFADKPIAPYINPGTEDNPCKLVQETCLPTYGFKHKLAMTDNIQEFITKVNGSEITGNLDNLEGGLDALMQVLVCREEIGWNDKTRKIVVFATDGPMHFAGDGLLAGLVKKNDKSCHLSDKGEYMASLEYDYPSLEEIYRELLRTKVSVIFAVTSDVIYHYDQMHEIMEEITSVGQLAADSSNILQLVEQGFKQAVKRAQFQDDAPDYLRVEYKTNCGGKYETLQDTNKCDNIEIGKEYEFDVGITLLKYPDDGAKSVKIKIEEANIDAEATEIDIEIDYPCTNCLAHPGEIASALCSRNGEYKCGACICDSGYVGKQCECNLQEYSSSKELDNQCREPKITNNNETKLMPPCSDRGECLCGECFCNANYEGKYCECETCPVSDDNGEECNGHALFCDCGVCQCQPEFTGPTCECSTLQTNCISPDSKMSNDGGKICSGHGTCKCNQCECEDSRTGKFCESTPGNETFNSLCIFYETCVQCVINRKLQHECSDYEQKCSSQNGLLYKSEFYDKISDADILCIARVRYDDDTVCEYKFTYELDEKSETNLRIENTDCPPVNVAAYSIIGIIVATFLIGFLILMVIKCNMYIAEKREFAAFEKERDQQTEYKYESPLYKSPVTTFRNPQSTSQSNAFEMK